MMQDNGGGNWYVGDQITGSGNDTSGSNSLTGLAATVNYGSCNSIVQWAPNASVYVGNCTTVTEGTTYNNVSLNSSTQVCPAHMDPELSNGTHFASHWSGCNNNNFTAGVNSTDVVWNPYNASSNPGLSVSIWWNWTC